MRGEFAIAFELLDESSAALAGFGPTVDAAVSHPEVFVAMLAGDLERAERAPQGGLPRSWSRWESGRCSPRPRATSHRCCC